MSDTEKEVPEYITIDAGVAVITLTDGSHISMREPTVADTKAARKSSKSNEEIEERFFCNLCELTPDELGKLTLKNYGRLQEAFGLFMS